MIWLGEARVSDGKDRRIEHTTVVSRRFRRKLLLGMGSKGSGREKWMRPVEKRGGGEGGIKGGAGASLAYFWADRGPDRCDIALFRCCGISAPTY